jgi:hypothetical protein
VYLEGKSCANKFKRYYKIDPNFRSSSGNIPKTIWAFWDSEKRPEIVENMFRAWKAFYPDYDIQMVTRKTLPGLISQPIPDVFDELIPVYKADWARFALLAENGGYWIDISTIFTNESALPFIQDIVLKENTEGFAFEGDFYTNQPEFPVIEIWFLASSVNATFMKAWFNEFDMLSQCFVNNGVNYNRYLKEIYGEEKYSKLVQNLGDSANYLRANVAAQKLAQIDKIPQLSSLPSTHPGYGLCTQFFRLKVMNTTLRTF